MHAAYAEPLAHLRGERVAGVLARCDDLDANDALVASSR